MRQKYGDRKYKTEQLGKWKLYMCRPQIGKSRTKKSVKEWIGLSQNKMSTVFRHGAIFCQMHCFEKTQHGVTKLGLTFEGYHVRNKLFSLEEQRLHDRNVILSVHKNRILMF